MPRITKKTSSSRPPLSAVILLITFFLIKLGSLPLLLIPKQSKSRRIYRPSLKINLTSLITNVIRGYTVISGTVRTFLSKFKLPSLSVSMPTRKPKPKKRGRKKSSRFLKRTVRFTIMAIIFLIGLGAYTIFTLKAAYELPNPNRLSEYDKPLTTEFYDRNGKLLYRLYEDRNTTLINLDQVPQNLVNATIAIEDKNFYHHFGVDFGGILRAAFHNFTQEDGLEGGSTITQQLIKNTILNSQRTYMRKMKEVILAMWTEALYSKQDILKMYFNYSPYGGPFWGAEAASQGYFGKPAKQLDLAESAYLAGLPASPTQYSPYGTKPELGKVRQQEVLKRMQEDGYISQEQADGAYNEPLDIKPQQTDIKAGHFVMYVKDLLSRKYGPRLVSQGGLKIYTTLDYSIQEQAQQIVADEIDKLASLDVSNGAAMVTDPRTGQILAMVGSKNYDDPEIGNYNATIASRQPGSSIKPATYAAAFEQGLSPGNTIVDEPITIKDPWGSSYTPVNYDGKFHGPVSIRTALASSYNIPAIKVIQKLGVPAMITMSKKLGITTFNDPSKYGLSITLGAAEVKMTDMMTVFGTFSQGGIKRTLTPILKVVDSSGNTLEEYDDNPQQVISPQVAYLITSVLSDNNARTPAFGPNSLLNIPGYQVAVKTGTSDDKRDNVTYGYTPNYVVGVWVGNNNNKKMNPLLTSGVTGAAPIWNQIMHTLVDGHVAIAFTRPAGIVDVSVDGRKDIAIASFVQNQAAAWQAFRSGKSPLDKNAFNIFSATYSAINTVDQKPVN